MQRLLFLFFIINSYCLFSQTKVSLSEKENTKSFISKYITTRNIVENSSVRTDTISLLYQKYLHQNDSIESLEYFDIEHNPYYYKLFTPLAYYYSPINSLSNIKWRRELYLPDHKNIDHFNISFDKHNNFDVRNDIINRTLMHIYLNSPNLIVTSENKIMNRVVLSNNVEDDINKKTKIIDLFIPEEVVPKVQKVDIKLKRPNWWTTGGNFSLQLTQNHISENWYKGGDNNYSGMFNLTLFANYDNKKNVLFENLFETRIGLNSTPSDKVHKFLINTDFVKLNSKIGVKAFKRWYYSMSADFKTQIFNGYKPNNATKISSLLSPADLAVSLGMDYKYRNKKINLSIFVAPLTYNMRYVHDVDLQVTRFGIEKDKRSRNQFGSQLKPVLSWTIFKYMTFESRLDYLTSYKWVRVEWENTFNFILNRYFSTRLFIHTRFDDNSAPVKGDSYFQFKEMLSFGINYRW